MDGLQRYGAGQSPQDAQQEAPQAEVDRMKEVIVNAISGEIQQLAELFASRDEKQLFGRTEFEVRDLVLKAGRKAVEAVVEDRKKRGTKAAV